MFPMVNFVFSANDQFGLGGGGRGGQRVNPHILHTSRGRGKWFARGRGRVSPISRPPPPPAALQGSDIRPPEKALGGARDRGPGGAPTYITSKQSPERAAHFGGCITGEKNVQTIFRPGH